MPTAIVTGASRGLGLALARALAEGRWRLVIDARGGDALERARRELAEHTEVVAIPGDIADPEHRRHVIEVAGNRIRLLVNNASVLGPSPQPPLADGRVVFEPSWSAVAGHLAGRARSGDVVMTLGAGDVTMLGPEILALLQASGSA